ncbi:MAG: tetratricopeptide repeat protein, partial [Acidobacteriota bacterium]
MRLNILMVFLLTWGTVTPLVQGQEGAMALPELLNRAESQLAQGDYPSAIQTLKEVLELQPEHKAARMALIDALMRSQAPDEAQSEMEALLNQFPTDSQVAVYGAAMAFSKTQFERAVELATRAIALRNTPVEAYRIRAFSYFMLEDYEKYKTDLLQMAEVDPESGEPHYHLGRFYYENQQFSEGLAALRKAVEVEPSHYKAHYFLGWCLQAQGDLESAKSSYRTSIQLVEAQKMGYGWPFVDLGEILITEGNMDDGLGWLYRALRNDPQLSYGHYKYASALMKTGPTPEVEQHLDKAIAL